MSSAPTANEPSPSDYDPTFLHSRREAWLIFGVWAVALIWAVPYCYIYGYSKEFDIETFETVWGIPSWAYWGNVIPWLVAILFSTWFCFFYMQDDDLGETHEGADIEEEIAEMHTADPKGAGA